MSAVTTTTKPTITTQNFETAIFLIFFEFGIIFPHSSSSASTKFEQKLQIRNRKPENRVFRRCIH